MKVIRIPGIKKIPNYNSTFTGTVTNYEGVPENVLESQVIKKRFATIGTSYCWTFQLTQYGNLQTNYSVNISKTFEY